MPINMPGKDIPVRLVSYLTTHPESKDTTYVLGLVDGFGLALRHLSLANDDSTTFYLDGDWSDFRMYAGQDRSKFLMWGNPQSDFRFSNNKNFLVPQVTFLSIDAVKADPWFALYDWNHQWVVDVAASHTADKSRIVSWKWNGGDNQIWRMEPVKS
jgi:hypothetical protein